MLNNMKVGTRLLAAFLIVAVLGACVAGIGIYNMAKMNEQAEHAYHNDLLGVSHLKEANINLIYIGRAARSVLLAGTPEDKKKFNGMLEQSERDMRSELNLARPLFVLPAGKALYAQLDALIAEYDPTLRQLVKLSQADTPEGKQAAVDYALTTMANKANQVDDKLTELSKLKEKVASDSAAEASRVYASTRLLMLVLVVLSLSAGIGLGLWITGSLTRQLGGEPAYAMQVAGAIAAGELATTIDTRQGDQSSLLYAMDQMRQSLIKIVGEVRTGTDTIATASNQIAVGNLDLSSRTEQQASSLEETASSMEELTSTVKQNADNARQANVLAVTASEVAQRGGQVVSEVVDTMASINESSRKIVDIISVIDGIAFQTNILALNAAVEAARAGEQGRGFAVVASEVRNLAQRSAAAAKEIKTLINDSVEKVDAGGRLVTQAGGTMEEIVMSITRVTDIMSEIASASGEQTVGIEQINMAITQMDEVTQQNAALVEEAAAAAGALQEQASTLAQLVSIFKLGNEQRMQRAAAPARKVPPPSTPAARRIAAPAPQQPRPQKAAAPAGGDDWEEF
jgi:methyl-accepting chemotaxis protein